MINKIKTVFQGLFNEYLQVQVNDNGPDPITQGNDDDMDAINQDPMAAWDKHVTLSAQSINIDSSELDLYLTKVPIRRTDQFNILAWWQMNSTEYPTLSRMARDILAVPASTVASESAFSTGKRVLSDFRSRMTPKTVEALVCLQDWIRATANTERSTASVHDIILEMEDDDDTQASALHGQP